MVIVKMISRDKQILKGQCLNIAANALSAENKPLTEENMKVLIDNAKLLFRVAMKEHFDTYEGAAEFMPGE